MPVRKTGGEGRQNPIRLKNLIAKAAGQLSLAGVSSSDAKDMLRPVEDLLSNEIFFEQQNKSFVAFLSRDFFESYVLKFDVEEEVVVGTHCFVKPILSLLEKDNEFYVLAVSKKQIRVLRCDSLNYQELEIEGIPKDLQDAIRFNDPERVLQYHTSASNVPGSRTATIFHGHGVGIDDEKDDILEYFRQIDKGIHSLLKEKKAPLILACVDYFHPLYKKMNSYSNLIDDGISGNAELLTNHEIYDQARDLLKPYFQRPLVDALVRYDQLGGTDRVSRNIENILSAARSGRVWNLFLQKGISWYGRFNADTGEVTSHDRLEAGDEEISNLAAIYTIQNGGTVFLMDRDPSKPSVCAVFRY
jgi:hypothetical protein